MKKPINCNSKLIGKLRELPLLDAVIILKVGTRSTVNVEQQIEQELSAGVGKEILSNTKQRATELIDLAIRADDHRALGEKVSGPEIAVKKQYPEISRQALSAIELHQRFVKQLQKIPLLDAMIVLKVSNCAVADSVLQRLEQNLSAEDGAEALSNAKRLAREVVDHAFRAGGPSSTSGRTVLDDIKDGETAVRERYPEIGEYAISALTHAIGIAMR